MGQSLTQQLPSASQPRWPLWWTLRSGLSLSPWFFTMQVCDDRLCCNSEWCRMLECVSPRSQTLPACINCPRLHGQLCWCDLEEHRWRRLPTSLPSQRHARVDTGWFTNTELSVLNKFMSIWLLLDVDKLRGNPLSPGETVSVENWPYIWN